MKLINSIKRFVNQSIQNVSPDKCQETEYATILNSMMETATWCVDTVKISENCIEVGGWAIPPGMDHSRVSFLINGEDFDEINYPTVRQDIKRVFWFIPGAQNSGFLCRLRRPMKEVFHQGYATFSYVNKLTRQPLRSEQNYYYCDPERDSELPIPDADRRIRVHGGDFESAFLIEGYSTYRKLQIALKKAVGKDYDDFKSILDWGCGCGRSSRYFSYRIKTSFTGVDIDIDNVNWCRNNLMFGNYLEIPLHPPTTIKDSTFDLLIGISIFTHLKEKEQFEWLDELRRIAANGAILLMTTHGNTTLCRAGLNYEQYVSLKEKGFLDFGFNPNLSTVLKENDYYKDVFHTREYIMDKWTDYFEVIDIIPGYIGNHQDLVIMKKR